MGIAKDIHQTKFRNERHKALINILFTYGWAVERLKEFVAEDGITHQQFNILRILRGTSSYTTFYFEYKRKNDR